MTVVGSRPSEREHMNDKDLLERVIDQDGLAAVVACLADIANDKAEHLRSAWQDDKLARSWERDAKKLQAVAAKLEN
jgi:hypothetical protein